MSARKLDYDLIAAKLAIVHPDCMLWGSHTETYPADDTVPAWILPYQKLQQQLGIFPLTGEEGNLVQQALDRLRVGIDE